MHRLISWSVTASEILYSRRRHNGEESGEFYTIVLILLEVTISTPPPSLFNLVVTMAAVTEYPYGNVRKSRTCLPRHANDHVS